MKKKILFVFLIAALLLGAGTNKIQAEDELTYTVYVDGGSSGSVDPADPVSVGYNTVLTIEPGDTYKVKSGNTVLYTVSVSDPKYYIKGLCISGQYLEPGDLVASVTVDQDIYLVPVFGVIGNRYSYKVYYHTADGTNLYDKECDEFFCNKNDTVVCGAKYFDSGDVVYKLKQVEFFDGESTTVYDATVGFRKEIDKDNTYEFTFIYEEVNAEETVTYDETYQYEPGQPIGTTPGGNEGTEPAPDIIDIDDPEPPTTDPEPTPGPNPTPNPEPEPEPEPKPTFWEILFSTPWLIGSVSAALLMLLLFLFFVWRRRREKNEK